MGFLRVCLGIYGIYVLGIYGMKISVYPLKIGLLPQGHESTSNDPFSGMLVSGRGNGSEDLALNKKLKLSFLIPT